MKQELISNKKDSGLSIRQQCGLLSIKPEFLLLQAHRKKTEELGDDGSYG